MTAVRHRFRSRADIEKFWRKVRSVGARARRTKRDEERYCLGLYLLARATHDLIDFPVIADEGESPEFLITEGGAPISGLEVTKATTPALQRAMTLSEQKNGAPALDLSNGGWLRDEGEKIWISLVQDAIERKLKKLPSYRKASRHDLLIYDDSPAIGVDREAVLAETGKWIGNSRSRCPLLGKVSIIMSLDVAFDVAGKCRLLPFIDWSAPESLPDFGERVEYAGRKSIADTMEEGKLPASKSST